MKRIAHMSWILALLTVAPALWAEPVTIVKSEDYQNHRLSELQIDMADFFRIGKWNMETDPMPVPMAALVKTARSRVKVPEGHEITGLGLVSWENQQPY